MRVVSTMTFGQEIALTFKERGWLPAILLVVGLALVIADIFTANLGKIGVPGGIVLIIAIVLRTHKHGAGNPVLQLFTMLCVCIVVIGIAVLVCVIGVKKGWIPRTVGESRSHIQAHEQSLSESQPITTPSAELSVVPTDDTEANAGDDDSSIQQ